MVWAFDIAREGVKAIEGRRFTRSPPFDGPFPAWGRESQYPMEFSNVGQKPKVSSL